MEGTSRGSGRNATERGKRRRSDEARNAADASTSKKHAGDDKCHPKKGSQGKPIDLLANYFRLIRRPDWLLYKYHVTFEPEVLMPRVRNALIFQHKPKFGGYLFDGTQLFLTRRLDDHHLGLVSTSREDVEYRITLQFTIQIDMNGNESNQVFNLILRRAMQGLQLTLVQRNYYDPQAAIVENLRNYNIQLWPGYDTSVRQHEYDILLNVDVRNKVMRTDTVYQLLEEARGSNDFRSEFQRRVVGITVLTDFNNATYRIDDVDFDKTPRSTFPKNGQEVSFVDYYQQKYGRTIRNLTQPLLVSRANARSIRGGSNEPILLVPELCRMTGLSEQQRTDMRLKIAMRPYTAMDPPQRIRRLMLLNQRLHSAEDSIKTLTEWDLQLDRSLVKVPGRQLSSQTIFFANADRHPTVNASWDRELRNKTLYHGKTLKRFYFIYATRLQREADNFLECLRRLAVNMRFQIGDPRKLAFQNENEMVRHLESAAMENPEMVVCVIENNRGDSYSRIKKKLCFEHAVPSQVVTKRSISRPDINSIVTKIAIQMCTKLGGAPWLPIIPEEGIMTIGFDVSVDTLDKRRSFGAIVATMDLQQVENGQKVNKAVQGVNFFSAVSEHFDADNLSTEFSLNIIKALHAYHAKHDGKLPKKIIIYRGGVGDGQIDHVRNIELETVHTKLKTIYDQEDSKLELLFIIVNKRINTRIFTGDQRNPPAGTIVDDVITQPGRYDFYLVPQNTNQGTASPTLYNVIHDSTDWSADRVQIWTYKMCHIYYNWSGTVRVPAVMQYATKLSFLIANSIHRLPNRGLEGKLYFL